MGTHITHVVRRGVRGVPPGTAGVPLPNRAGDRSAAAGGARSRGHGRPIGRHPPPIGTGAAFTGGAIGPRRSELGLWRIYGGGHPPGRQRDRRRARLLGSGSVEGLESAGESARSVVARATPPPRLPCSCCGWISHRFGRLAFGCLPRLCWCSACVCAFGVVLGRGWILSRTPKTAR